MLCYKNGIREANTSLDVVHKIKFQNLNQWVPKHQAEEWLVNKYAAMCRTLSKDSDEDSELSIRLEETAKLVDAAETLMYIVSRDKVVWSKQIKQAIDERRKAFKVAKDFRDSLGHQRDVDDFELRVLSRANGRLIRANRAETVRVKLLADIREYLEG